MFGGEICNHSGGSRPLCEKSMGLHTLNPLSALFVYLFWRNPKKYGDGDFTGQALCDDLNRPISEKKDITPNLLSNYRQGRIPLSDAEQEFAHLLNGEFNSEKRALIAAKLGCPELFSFSTQQELLDNIIGSFSDRLDSGEVVIQKIGEGNADFVGLEKRIVEEISTRLNHSRYPILSWTRRFDTGAAQLLHKLALSDSIKKNYDTIAHVWPSSFDAPFQSQLLQLCRTLSGDRPFPVSPAGVLKLLRGSKTLVVIHLIEAIELATIHNPVLSAILDETLKEIKLIYQTDHAPQIAQESFPQILLSGTKSFFDIVGQAEKYPGAKREIDEVTNTFNKVVERSSNADERVRAMREARLQIVETNDKLDLIDTGPLLRRAELTHAGNHAVEGAPIHQRIRARAISRHDNRSSFLDPTAGFQKLVGGDFTADPDIAMFQREVSEHVDYLWERNKRTKSESGKQKVQKAFKGVPDLTAILMVSTGLYWVSRNALEKMLSVVRIEPEGVNLGSHKGIRRLPVSDNRYWIHEVEEVEDSKVKRYFCSLGAKAVLQDSWRRHAPMERRRALYLVAEFLNSIEDDKLRLPEEYPYAPHWGRSRIYFLGEKIRFLIRSLEDSKPSETQSVLAASRSFGEFPRSPQGTDELPSPRAVINYCYRTVFRQEMNGDRWNDNKRNLSKRHGAFQYAAELLALMSGGETIGIPHPELDESVVGEFVRECGLALLDLGLLSDSISCFNRLEEMTNNEVEAQRESGDTGRTDMATLHYLDATLVSILPLFTKGDLQSGASKLRKAEKKLADWERERHHVPIESGGPEPRISRYFKRRKRQIELRRAHELYLSGAIEDCRKVVALLTSLETTRSQKVQPLLEDAELLQLVANKLQHLEVSEMTPHREERDSEFDHDLKQGQLTAERAPLAAELSLLKIAALKRLAIEAGDEHVTLQEALRVCMQNLLSASSDGRHHDEMGFRISLASIYRRLKSFDLAETILDEVHSSLLSFGGSERTYLAFLAESGDLLFKTNRVIHGYATYLRPCILRAHALGFDRTVKRATELAIPELEKLLVIAKDAEANRDTATKWRDQIVLALANHKLLDNETKQFRRDENFTKSAGSLFAYSIVEPQELILDIGTAKGIERELAFCRNLGTSMCVS